MRCYQDFEVLITRISDRNIRVFSGASDLTLYMLGTMEEARVQCIPKYNSLRSSDG